MQLLVTAKEQNSVATVDLPAEGRLVLGRSLDSPVPLDGPAISREHIALESKAGVVYVADLSANGSWLNGKPVPRGEWAAVTPADLIEVPGYEIRIQAPAVATAHVAEAPAPAAVRSGGLGDLKRALTGSLSGVEKLSLALFVISIGIAAAYLLSL